MRKLNGENVKLAIQKEGRLTEETLNLLRTAGLHFESYKQRLFSACRNFPLDILYVRDDDIPEYVAEGVVDLGIVGRNLVVETEQPTDELLALDYGHCTLTIAVPRDSDITDLNQLAGCKVATSYPVATRRFFAERDIEVEVITISGSVEITPALGVATAIADLVSTGSSLKLNDLTPLATVFESQSLLVANRELAENERKAAIVERLLLRFRGALAAREYKYIMMNAPRAALPRIYELCPGLKSPTVLPTADPDWVAVHTVVREDVFWEVIEQLRLLGTQGILVSPIEKMFI